MAYENQNPGTENPQASANTVHIPADMFPPGMAETLKAGEVIEFKIVAPPDSEGDVEIAYNYGEPNEGGEPTPEQAETGEGEGGSWEDEARKELNPQAEES